MPDDPEAEQKTYEVAEDPENSRAAAAGKESVAGRDGMSAKTPTPEQRAKMKRIRVTPSAKDMKVREEDGRKLVEVPIQATEEDRDGDLISEEGQKALVEQLQSGTVRAFPNHGIGSHSALYDFRDIMGLWVDGRMEDGVTYGTLQLREGNQAADHLVDLFEQDIGVPFSIGFIPLDTEEREETDGMLIHDEDLMEVSPVGIPSNPEADPQANAAGVAVAKAVSHAINSGGGPDAIGKAVADALQGEQLMGDEPEEQREPAEEAADEKEASEPEQDDGTEQQDDGNTEEMRLSEKSLEKVRDTVKDAVKEALAEAKESDDDDDDDDEEEDSAAPKDGEPEEQDDGEPVEEDGLDDEEKTVDDGAGKTIEKAADSNDEPETNNTDEDVSGWGSTL